MPIAIEIRKIKEDEFVIKHEDLKKIDKNKLSIGFNVLFEWNLQEENFVVKVSFHYNYKIKDEVIELLRFSLTIIFKVKGLKDILKIDGNEFHMPDFYIRTFLSTAVATARGMLVYKLAGTYLSEFYLPLIDSKAFLDYIQKPKMQSLKTVAKRRVKVAPKPPV